MKKRLFCLSILTVALIGCADLKEVRDFAGESAKLAAYTDLTNRFRDTYKDERSRIFLEKKMLKLLRLTNCANQPMMI